MRRSRGDQWEQVSDQLRTVLSTREEKELRGLQRRKIREQQGRFLAEGVRVVEDLLASPVAVRWVVAASSLEDSERGRALAREIDRRGIPRRSLDDRAFEAVAATESPQGILAVADIPHWEMSSLPRGGEAVVLVLDAVQDPGNFGTLVRSAEALGATGVVALPGTVDAWNPKAVRSAMGSSFRQPIIAAGWPEAAAWLRAEGYRLLAADAGGEPLGDRGPARAALVVGNEGSGISRDVLAGVDRTVGIPLRGRAESLNVAAAAAILLFQLTR